MHQCDVDRFNANYLTDGQQLWGYTPSRHKTEHHVHGRVIPIGLKAQPFLLPYLLRDAEAYCFSPAENDQRAGKPRPSKAEVYDKDSFAIAFEIACELAFNLPSELRGKPRKLGRMSPEQRAAELRRRDLAAAWRAEYCWVRNQLRHASCEEVEQTYGYETGRVLLGHFDVKTTKIYAGRDLARELAAIRGLRFALSMSKASPSSDLRPLRGRPATPRHVTHNAVQSNLGRSDSATSRPSSCRCSARPQVLGELPLGGSQHDLRPQQTR